MDSENCRTVMKLGKPVLINVLAMPNDETCLSNTTRLNLKFGVGFVTNDPDDDWTKIWRSNALWEAHNFSLQI